MPTLKPETRTSVVDLGWCMARLTETKGILDEDGTVDHWSSGQQKAAWHPTTLTIVSPGENDNISASSVMLYGPEAIRKLKKLLSEV